MAPPNDKERGEYEFQINYEYLPSESKSLFPYKYSFLEYPENELGNIVSKHEYQSIIELLLMSGPPHFLMYGSTPAFLTLLLIISILLIKSVQQQTIFSFLVVFFIISILALPFSIYNLIKVFRKKKLISNELKKRDIELKTTFRFRKYNSLFVLLTYFQLIVEFIFYTIKYNAKNNFVVDETIMKTIFILLILFVIIDIVLIIYLTYNLMLFSKYRDILTNTTQCDHINYLIQNIKKFDFVPFYLSYPLNSINYQQNQPLLMEQV